MAAALPRLMHAAGCDPPQSAADAPRRSRARLSRPSEPQSQSLAAARNGQWPSWLGRLFSSVMGRRLQQQAASPHEYAPSAREAEELQTLHGAVVRCSDLRARCRVDE
jgi:hypothetical protein